jgi:DNA polymerase-3 subunit delta
MASRTSSYDDLATAIRHGNFKPVYLLYGEERWFIESLQELLVERVVAPHERDSNLDIVYGAESDAQSVLAICASYPMMAERRLVVVRDFDKLKDNRKFQSYAAQPNPSAVVLLVCSGKPKFNAHPYLALKKAGAATEFKALYPNQVTGWIERLAKEKGYAIEPKATQMLADYVGTQLQTAESELEKLATFAGSREVLTAEDVVQASGQTREFNVFELQNAIGEMRQNDAFRITERLLQQTSNQSGECARIVTVLTSYYMKLWKLTVLQNQKLSEKEMARRIGVSPFFIKEYLECLRRIDGNALNRAFNALLAADYELKGGSSRSEKLVLNLMLRRMLTPVIAPSRLSSKKMGALA